MSDRICPQCLEFALARRKRRGFFQFVMLPLVGVYPWECLDCNRIFYRRSRGRTVVKPAAHVPATHSS